MSEPRVPGSHRAGLQMARELAACPGQLVTWLNHYSILVVDWASLERFSAVGVDGTLLQMFIGATVGRVERTSADIVLPYLLELTPDARLALIGGLPGVAESLSSRLPGVVYYCDGFGDYASQAPGFDELRDAEPDLVIVGMGPGRQEQSALEIAAVLPEATIATCGGWFDQMISRENYFPPIVHTLRVGWLIRLLREPLRLYRRYTRDAVAFAVAWRAIAKCLQSSCILPTGTAKLFFTGKRPHNGNT